MRYFPLGHGAFNPSDNERGRKPFIDDGEHTRSEWQAFRDLLSDTFGETELDRLLRLYVEQSCTENGSALGRHRTTAWRLKQRKEPALIAAILLATFRPAQPLPVEIVAYVTSCRVESMAKAGLSSVARTGGGTISPRTARPVVADVWVASLKGCEQRHRSLSLPVVCSYIRDQGAKLFAADDLYFGLSRDTTTNEVCSDVSKVFPDTVSAIAFACENDQCAVTNLKSLRTVWVPRAGRRAP
jgi:hypothetical protein